MTYEPTATKRYQYRRAGLVTKKAVKENDKLGGFVLLMIVTMMVLLPALLNLN